MSNPSKGRITARYHLTKISQTKKSNVPIDMGVLITDNEFMARTFSAHVFAHRFAIEEKLFENKIVVIEVDLVTGNSDQAKDEVRGKN